MMELATIGPRENDRLLLSEQPTKSTTVGTQAPSDHKQEPTRSMTEEKPSWKYPFRSFFRSVGIKALWMVLRDLKKRKRSKSEPPKILISQSVWIALARITIHLLPITISIFLVQLNIRRTLHGTAISAAFTFLLQVVAKLHVSVFYYTPYGSDQHHQGFRFLALSVLNHMHPGAIRNCKPECCCLRHVAVRSFA